MRKAVKTASPFLTFKEKTNSILMPSDISMSNSNTDIPMINCLKLFIQLVDLDIIPFQGKNLLNLFKEKLKEEDLPFDLPSLLS